MKQTQVAKALALERRSSVTDRQIHYLLSRAYGRLGDNTPLSLTESNSKPFPATHPIFAVLLLLAAATFAGNDACRPCHSEIVRKYEMTPMSRSIGLVRNNVPPGSFRHAASNTGYSIAIDGVVAMNKGHNREEDRFDFVISSGAAGFSYLIFRGRYLFQAPITWYSQKNRWDAVPGYQDDSAMTWDRPVDRAACYATRVRSRTST